MSILVGNCGNVRLGIQAKSGMARWWLPTAVHILFMIGWDHDGQDLPERVLATTYSTRQSTSVSKIPPNKTVRYQDDAHVVIL